MKEKQIVGYIMTGGKNTRMQGKKKLFLTLEGKSFWNRICEALSDLMPVYLSVEQEEPYKNLPFPLVIDAIPDIGPMGGIYTGLKMLDAQALFVVACDMPFLSKQTVSQLLEQYQKSKKITIACEDNRLHPLLGIYPKSALANFEAQIASGNYRLMDILSKTEYVTVKLSNDDLSATNINSIAEYQKLCIK